MRLTYGRYLTWLYLEGLERSQIRKTLDELSLPEVPDDVMEVAHKTADELPIPPALKRRLREQKLKPEVDHAWLKKIGLLDFATCRQAGPLWDEIWALCKQPLLRIAVECCLLIKHPVDEIIHAAQTQYGVTLTRDGLALFERTLFQWKELSKSDWREMLTFARSDSFLFERYYAALTAPAEETLHLVRFPIKPAFSEFLRNLLATADYKFKRHSGTGTELGDAEARRWAKMGIDAGIRYEKFASKDARDFAETLQTEFAYVENTIPQATGEMLSGIKLPTGDVDKDEKHSVPNPPPLVQQEFEV